MATKELALFLAHSLEVESEAGERYQELADVLIQHHNAVVGEFFQRMAQEAQHHEAEVTEIVGKLELPQLKPWEFEWLDLGPPESASYEAVHYRMSLRDAMELALQQEQAAHKYYQHVAESAADVETVRLARQFADEELSHAAELQRLLAELPQDSAHRLEEDDDPHMPE